MTGSIQQEGEGWGQEGAITSGEVRGKSTMAPIFAILFESKINTSAQSTI